MLHAFNLHGVFCNVTKDVIDSTNQEAYLRWQTGAARSNLAVFELR